MGEWPMVRLGDLADADPGAIAIGPFGSRMKADCYAADGVPVIRGTNISGDRAWKGDWVHIPERFADSMPNCNAVQNDLVFPHRGSIGEVAIVPGDRPRYMLSTSLMKFRSDRDKANPLFLFYYFRSSIGRDEILKFSSQVGTPGIGQPLTSLRQFKVPLPPLRIQDEIAGLLAILDDKIELNRQISGTVEATARAIFKDWFVDFGPTCAKAEGRSPYLAKEIWNVFPDALNEI
jgi:type I restriction enzyme S subunit